MPEGVEIRVMCDLINLNCRNKMLKNVNILSGRYTRHGNPEGYLSFRKNLPMKIKKAESYGKLLWILIGNWIIYIKLNMSGHILFYKNKHSHIEFKMNTDKFTFYLDDLRNFATIEFLKKDDFHKKVASMKLGYDIFDKKLNISYLEEKIKKYNMKKPKMIGEILMEQDFIAGIGNYMRSEILYNSGISPYRKINMITKTHLQNILKNTKKIALKRYKRQLKEGVDICGHGGEKVKYIFDVYKRKRTNKNEHITSEKFKNKTGLRKIYWVKKIQK